MRPANSNAPVQRRERLGGCSTSTTGAQHESPRPSSGTRRDPESRPDRPRSAATSWSSSGRRRARRHQRRPNVRPLTQLASGAARRLASSTSGYIEASPARLLANVCDASRRDDAAKYLASLASRHKKRDRVLSSAVPSPIASAHEPVVPLPRPPALTPLLIFIVPSTRNACANRLYRSDCGRPQEQARSSGLDLSIVTVRLRPACVFAR
jgi:hypothetical protein